jgi:ElaB/YqjD/DUF883 family membrane-anchored ribosome-binding protein
MSEKVNSEMASKAINQAADSAREYSDAAREYAGRGYDAAREYASRGYDATREYASVGMEAASNFSSNLEEFVRKDPWIAIVSAFAVGYLAARMLRRVSA